MFCCMVWVINAMFLSSTRWRLIGKAINNKRSKMSSRPTRRPKTMRRKKNRNKTSFSPHPKTDFHPTPRIFNCVYEARSRLRQACVARQRRRRTWSGHSLSAGVSRCEECVDVVTAKPIEQTQIIISTFVSNIFYM